MYMSVYVFLCVYLNVVLALQLEEGWIHLGEPKLDNQKKQVKQQSAVTYAFFQAA